MTYPEKGAGYRHMPKFMDRALAAERRADGGDVTSNNDPIEPMPSTAEKLEHYVAPYLQRMRNDEGGRGLSDWSGSFGDNEGLLTHTERWERMPVLEGEDTGDHMEADTPTNRSDPMRAVKPKRDGGRVRKRADGGKISDPMGDLGGSKEWSRGVGSPLSKATASDLSDANSEMQPDMVDTDNVDAEDDHEPAPRHRRGTYSKDED